MKQILLAGSVVLALAAYPPAAAEAASLDVTPSRVEMRAGTGPHCGCHRKWRRHAVHARGRHVHVVQPVEDVDWAVFDPCCRPTGHPRPRGFCGGRDFYLGGVW
jgi:hypothetical protein